jgi:type II secretory pathway component PulL
MIVDCFLQPAASKEPNGEPLLPSLVLQAPTSVQTGDCILLLPSLACMSTWIEIHSKTIRQQAISFRLEELLPVDLEDIEAQFIKSDDGVLAVSVLRSILLEALNQVEATSITVPWITPRALLCAQSIASETSRSSFNAVVVIYTPRQKQENVVSTGNLALNEDYFDVVRISSGLPVSWHVVAVERGLTNILKFVDHPIDGECLENPQDTPASTSPQLQPSGDTKNSTEAEYTLILVDVPSELADQLVNQQGSPRRLETRDSDQCIIQMMQSLQRGTQSPWVNFRDGSLGTSLLPSVLARWVWTAQGLTLVALTALCILFGLSSWIDNQTLREEQGKQASIYRDLFPQQKIPRSIRRTLDSELIALLNSKPSSANISHGKSNAAWVWFHAMRSIPNNPRSRIQSMQFVDDRIVLLEGVTGSVDDLNQLIDALRQNGFSFALPNIQKAGSTVRIEIRDAILSADQIEALYHRFAKEG